MVKSVQLDLCLQLCLLQKRYFQLGREALAIIFGVKRSIPLWERVRIEDRP